MNFISRNLGWILLFLFFLFMLFIISTNQKKEGEMSLSGTLETSSGENMNEKDGNPELEKLVEKITEEESVTSKDEEVDSQEEKMENDIQKEPVDSTGAVEPEKKSIFDIFKRKDDTKEEISQTGSLDDSEQKEDITSQDDVKSEQETTNTHPVDSLGQGITKVTGTSKALAAAPIYFDTPIRNSSINLPGIHLETEIGKVFQVGVLALKLNDKTFQKKLAYMSEGDTLKQLTQENIYGCFQVEILSSSTPSNLGKIGYVCKKYLADISPKDTQSTLIENNKETSYTVEKIYFKPNLDNLVLRDEMTDVEILTLERTDILLKTSLLRKDGTFQVKIVGSNTLENHGIEGFVHFQDVQEYSIPN